MHRNFDLEKRVSDLEAGQLEFAKAMEAFAVLVNYTRELTAKDAIDRIVYALEKIEQARTA